MNVNTQYQALLTQVPGAECRTTTRDAKANNPKASTREHLKPPGINPLFDVLPFFRFLGSDQKFPCPTDLIS